MLLQVIQTPLASLALIPTLTLALTLTLTLTLTLSIQCFDRVSGRNEQALGHIEGGDS